MTSLAETGKIGPNAITRMAEAIALLAGDVARDRVFIEAGLAPYLTDPPSRMVPDEEVALLHATVFAILGVPLGRAIGAEAGRRTGAYLLAHRIPKMAHKVLPLLPPRLALYLLLQAVHRHAWTFAGRGIFAWEATRDGFELTLENNPVSRKIWAEEPVCDFYRTTFETLFQALAGPQIRIEEIACTAEGDPRCVFRVTL